MQKQETPPQDFLEVLSNSSLRSTKNFFMAANKFLTTRKRDPLGMTPEDFLAEDEISVL